MSSIVLLPGATGKSFVQPRRIVALDLAKGFTVLFIPIIHVFMLYGTPAARKSFIGYPLQFIAEWPGAQLLMFVMGVSFSFSKKSLTAQLKRAVMIFILGYVLNAFKFLFLYWLHWLPQEFLNDLQFSHGYGTPVHLLLIGDILQFAGIALALMAIIKRFAFRAAAAVLVSYVVIVCVPVFWDWHHPNAFVDHLLHLLGGHVPDVFFPVAPWIVYPLVGFAIGEYWRWGHKQHPIYINGTTEFAIVPVFVTGAFLFISGYCMPLLPWHFPGALFWRTYPDKTIMHLGFVIVWVSASTALSMTANRNKVTRAIVNLLCFCGRNITAIYIIQWLVIFWMLPLFGYQCLEVGESLIAAGLIYVIVFGIVLLREKVTKYTKDTQRSQSI